MPQVKIDKLHFRVKGRSPHFIMSAVDGLGNQIQSQISRNKDLLYLQGRSHIDRIELEPIHLKSATKPSELSAQISKKIFKIITRSSI
jgi:hypothetical protein